VQDGVFIDDFEAGWNSETSAADNAAPVPIQFKLGQNYPNPFNGSTTIDYALPKTGNIRLEVYNILGQRVAVLLEERKEAGLYSYTWDAAGWPSGVYFYNLKIGKNSGTKKMLFLK
jgi:hypothetical protein